MTGEVAAFFPSLCGSHGVSITGTKLSSFYRVATTQPRDELGGRSLAYKTSENDHPPFLAVY
jgi:hypothetical protein